MPKLSEMYPSKYATGDDLAGKAHTLTIHRVEPQEMRPGPGSPPVNKWVMYFLHAQKGVILNRTLAEQIATILDSNDTDAWTGKKITIYPVPMTVAGQQRIAIRAKVPTNGESTPPPALQDDPDEEV